MNKIDIRESFKAMVNGTHKDVPSINHINSLLHRGKELGLKALDNYRLVMVKQQETITMLSRQIVILKGAINLLEIPKEKIDSLDLFVLDELVHIKQEVDEEMAQELYEKELIEHQKEIEENVSTNIRKTESKTQDREN
jgi:hypothetical protein